MDTAKRSVGSSHGVPAIANAMETPLSALVVLPSRSLMRALLREHVLLFCLLGLVLTATIILVIAPGGGDLGAVPHRLS